MAVATVTYRAEISDLRKKLASIPDITGAEARKAVAELNKSIRAVEKAQTRAVKSAKATSAGVTSSFGGMVSSIAPVPPAISAIPGPLGMVTAGLGAAAAATYKLADANSQWVDQTLTMADTIGVEANTVIALGAALNAGGQDISAAQTGMAAFTKTLDDAQQGNTAAAEKFERLGIAVTDASGEIRDTEAVFRDTLDALAAMGTGVEKSGASMDIFGSKGSRFVAALGDGSAALDKWGAAAAEAGAVIDSGAIAASTAMDEAMARLTLSTTGAASSFGEAFTPNVVASIDAVAKLVTMVGGLADALQTAGQVAKWITVTPGLIGLAVDAWTEEEAAVVKVTEAVQDLGEAEEDVAVGVAARVTSGVENERKYQEAVRKSLALAKERADWEEAQGDAQKGLIDLVVAANEDLLTEEQKIVDLRDRRLEQIANLEAVSGDYATAEVARLAVIADAERDLAEVRAEARAQEVADTQASLAAWDSVRESRAAAAEADAAASQQARDDARDRAVSTIESTGNVIATVADATTAVIMALSQDSEKAARRVFAVQKAAAIAQVVVDTARAIMNGFASLPPPVAVPYAVMLGVQGAAQIATITKEQPSFHTGTSYYDPGRYGMDEGPAKLRMGEAVVPADANRRNPGVVDMMMKGGSVGGDNAQWVLKIGHKAYRAQARRDVRQPGSPIREIARGDSRVGHRSV
jgi:hypothetical protein